MIKTVYAVALILIFGWAIDFFGFHAGNWVYLLLLQGMIAKLINTIVEG
jgi:hypothetical protein